MKKGSPRAKAAKRPTKPPSKQAQSAQNLTKKQTKRQSQNSGGKKQPDPTLQAIGAVQYSIDILIAILLLGGQLSTTGIFVVPDGFAFSTSGDIFHFTRVHGLTQALSLDMDFIDVVLALLLIVGQIRVQGPYMSDSGLFVVLAGPIFGYASVPAPFNPFAPTKKGSTPAKTAKTPAKSANTGTDTEKLQQTTEKSRLLGQVLKEEALKKLSG